MQPRQEEQSFQEKLENQFKAYLRARIEIGKDQNDPRYQETNSVDEIVYFQNCTGFSILLATSIKLRQERTLLQKLKAIINWDPSDHKMLIDDNGETELSRNLEEIISQIYWLSGRGKGCQRNENAFVNQVDQSPLITAVLPKNVEPITRQFHFVHLFSQEELASFLNQIITDGCIVTLVFLGHAASITLRDEVFYYCNSDKQRLIIEYHNLNELIANEFEEMYLLSDSDVLSITCNVYNHIEGVHYPQKEVLRNTYNRYLRVDDNKKLQLGYALFQSAVTNNIEAFNFFLSLGANINTIVTTEGDSKVILDLALLANYKVIVATALDINARYFYHPSHIKVLYNTIRHFPQTARQLLRYFPSLIDFEYEGLTTLRYIVAISQSRELLSYALAISKNVDAIGPRGMNALILATFSGNLLAIQQLLIHSANPLILYNGNSILDIALYRNFHLIAEYLVTQVTLPIDLLQNTLSNWEDMDLEAESLTIIDKIKYRIACDAEEKTSGGVVVRSHQALYLQPERKSRDLRQPPFQDHQPKSEAEERTCFDCL